MSQWESFRPAVVENNGWKSPGIDRRKRESMVKWIKISSAALRKREQTAQALVVGWLLDFSPLTICSEHDDDGYFFCYFSHTPSLPVPAGFCCKRAALIANRITFCVTPEGHTGFSNFSRCLSTGRHFRIHSSICELHSWAVVEGRKAKRGN